MLIWMGQQLADDTQCFGLSCQSISGNFLIHLTNSLDTISHQIDTLSYVSEICRETEYNSYHDGFA